MENQKLEKDPIKQFGLNRHGEEAPQDKPKKESSRSEESEETNLNTSGVQEGPR